MNPVTKLLIGAGMGAGLMYILDPRLGRQRRARVRDQMMHLAREAQGAAEGVARDMKNRAQGLAAGDDAVLAGGRQALSHPLRGGWSPSARALMGLMGGGLFLFGLTRTAPTACILGTVGLAVAAEGLTNAGLDDLKRVSQQTAQAAGQVAENLG
ncbi:MAG: hypothetical protein JO112_22455, partial [Planctomycetes bacterium]|nr:hypothetical protein [Planctomycetota bacterium]